MSALQPLWMHEWYRQLKTAVLAEDLVVEDSVLQTSQAAQSLLHLQAFSETDIALRTICVREDTVDIQGVFSGSHTAHFAGIPPTHRRIEVPINLTCTIRQARITRAVLSYDAPVLLKQLGLLP